MSVDDVIRVKHERRYAVPALEKGLGLLRMLGEHRGELSFSDICQRTTMPKASVYRAVQTLEEMGFLARGTSGGYALGISVLRLGFDYLSSMDIVQIGQPVIHRLRDNTDCSSHLCVRDGRDVVYVARVAASGEIGAGVSIGSRLPAHCTAIGRVLLMDLPRSELERLYTEAVFAETSEAGPKTPQQLFDLLDGDREQGYAISESFYQPGISAVAYPLRNRSGDVVASVNVMAPRHNLPDKLKASLRQEVAQAADEIESYLQVTR
ncbi:IclR family transcriptional regulator [Dyella caseinilytica]|uniref:IclR family transcriptional regulator n=1 Tax=Dyella caseinilytica TaxID=1849581 RepID=A0ABX7GRW5_9GAMM|nr:IclR family transcriptional regulator [Dyella caseinilytica]QRN53171.1 IclR family transcriptional regulator [Dyella caseinilytica]GGA12007.1 IclR family transcriptional regulator [Dyella caseinilytica]